MLDGDPNLPLTTQQVAAYLRCHPRTVRRMIRDGILPARKISGEYVIRRADFDAWWRRQSHPPCPWRSPTSNVGAPSTRYHGDLA